MAILPGATIGILGGGQLGRMSAMAAREMGYRVRVLDPDGECAARFLSDEHIRASFEDEGAAERLARSCDVVTLEIEKVGVAALERARAHAPTRPGPELLAVIQDRARQKTWLRDHGLPVGPFGVAHGEAELATELERLDGACFVKAARGGYDGRGQFETTGAGDGPAAWRALFPTPADGDKCVVERALAIDAEISVLVARRPSGELAVYPPALNHHEARILAWSALPAPIDSKLSARARELGRAIAEGFGLEGLLCVELFVVGGELLVNELAPRPHNSYHATFVGCATSQFEQHVRAICDLPLGSTTVVRPAAIANILGDAWTAAGPPAFESALALEGVRIHLYGKAEARPGRKMGHLSATAATPEEAAALVRRASALLVGRAAG